MKIGKVVLLGILLIITILMVGCSTHSQYWLTQEFTQNGISQRIDIPVSKYQYDSINIGDPYSIKVHTVVLGIQVPIIEDKPNPKISIVDIYPIILAMVGIVVIIIRYGSTPEGQKASLAKTIIIPVGIVLLIFFGLTSTLEPDFIANGIIVDKDFTISN